MARSDKPGRPRRRIRIAVLGYPGCSSWIASGMLELFALANLPGASRTRPIFECEMLTPSGRMVRASHGVRLPAAPLRSRYHAVIAPPIWSTSLADFERRIRATRRLAPMLRKLAARTKIMASACSGAVLLAQAGLLAERRATTCWWLAKWFAESFPEVRLDAGKLLVIDRARWTAAAGTAYVHLCLEMVKEFAGAETSAATARLALVEPRRGSQSPFLGSEVLRPSVGTGLAQRLAQSIELQLANDVSVQDLARQLKTTGRTLHRRFLAAFGVPPLAYLQSRRIALAKRLLEVGDEPLERVVERCGYADVSSFRKLFAREVGMTPREYRLRFQR